MPDHPRDPRWHPRSGDLVNKGNRTRHVRYVCWTTGLITYWTQTGGERYCELPTWRRWAKGAEVGE